MDTERSSVHISDDTGRVCMIDSLLVDGGSVVSTPTLQYRYLLSNHLGSSSIELDEAAALISYEEYYPFGSSSYRSGRNAAETSLKRYRYVDKERDDETGLYYYGARYYADWLARFVSVDPLKDDYPQLASYQYAGNDPLGDIDIDGLEGTKTKKLLTVKSATTNIDPLRNRKLEIEIDRNKRTELNKFLSGETVRIDPSAPVLRPAKRKTADQIRETEKQIRTIEFKKDLERLRNSVPPESRLIGEGINTGLVIMSPSVLVSTPIKGATTVAKIGTLSKQFAVGSGINLFSQAATKRDFSKIDFADAFSSGLSSTITKNLNANIFVDATLSSTIDLTQEKGLETIFNGKKGEIDVLKDFGAGVAAGFLGNASDKFIAGKFEKGLLADRLRAGLKPIVKKGIQEALKTLEGQGIEKIKENIPDKIKKVKVRGTND